MKCSRWIKKVINGLLHTLIHTYSAARKIMVWLKIEVVRTNERWKAMLGKDIRYKDPIRVVGDVVFPGDQDASRVMREIVFFFAGHNFSTYLVSKSEDNPAVFWSKCRPCASCDADSTRTAVSTRWRVPGGIFCGTRAAAPRRIGRFRSRTSRNAWETAGSFLNRTPPPFRRARRWEWHGSPTETGQRSREISKTARASRHPLIIVPAGVLTHTTNLSSSFPDRWRQRGTLRRGLLTKTTWQCCNSEGCLVATSWQSFHTFSSLKLRTYRPLSPIENVFGQSIDSLYGKYIFNERIHRINETFYLLFIYRTYYMKKVNLNWHMHISIHNLNYIYEKNRKKIFTWH